MVRRAVFAVALPVLLATPVQAADIEGTATWYCGTSSACTHGYGPSDMVGAIDPTLGIPKGTLLRVSSGGRSIVVRVVDVCACAGRRVIDLTSGAFSRLAPTSRGVIPVALDRVERAATPRNPVPVSTLPPTDTAPLLWPFCAALP